MSDTLIPVFCDSFVVEVAAKEDRVFAAIERPCLHHARSVPVTVTDNSGEVFTVNLCSTHRDAYYYGE